MFTARTPYTPSPSPPSSPTPCIDSSPPSSPSLEPIILDSGSPPPPIHLTHPFAASIKANRTPPQYEKKPATPPTTPRTPTGFKPVAKKPRYAYRNTYENDDYLHGDVIPHIPPLLEDPESAIWDDAITKVVDTGHGAVTLMDLNLSKIPQKFVTDLDKFFVPPEKSERANVTKPDLTTAASTSGGRLFTRVNTAPASSTSSLFGRTPSERTRSIADISLGLPREEIQLFLSGNRIHTLPLELFSLQKMTVLIMRANLITYLPPEIALLSNLRELNLSNNRLRYLPSEMLNMTLTRLHVHPNPFLSPPVQQSQPKLSRSLSLWSARMAAADHSQDIERPVSAVIRILPRIIPLVELTFRALFSSPRTPISDPDPFTPHRAIEPNLEECVLSAQFELPLWEDPKVRNEPPPPLGKIRNYRRIPQHLKEILDTCVPGSTYEDDTPLFPHCDSSVRPVAATDDERVTGIGLCPSPRHKDKSIFARHAEMRYTWEEKVAGVGVGGAVPVRWRGCHWGCLDFLDANAGTDKGEEADTDGVYAEGISAGENDDVEMEGIEEPEVIQLVNIGSGVGGFGISEFDD